METTVTKYVVQISTGPRGGKPWMWMYSKWDIVEDLDKAFTFRHENAAQKKADWYTEFHKRKAWVVKIEETRRIVE